MANVVANGVNFHIQRLRRSEPIRPLEGARAA